MFLLNERSHSVSNHVLLRVINTTRCNFGGAREGKYPSNILCT